MNKIINISEASSLAIHSLILIALSNEKINSSKISKITNFSKNHLAKVLQILVRNSFLESERGPKGGFILKKEPKDIKLLDIYQLFEGNLSEIQCEHCNRDIFKSCVFGNMQHKLVNEFFNYLNNTTIYDFLKK